MKRHGLIALTMGIAFVAAFGLGSGCALFQKKVADIPADIKACFGPDVKGDLGDIVKGVETALACELASGGQALPACVTEGLQTIAEEIGPSGKADVMCVVTMIANDAAARADKAGVTPEEAVRDQRAKLLTKRGALASLDAFRRRHGAQGDPATQVPVLGNGTGADHETASAGNPSVAERFASCDAYCGAGHGLPLPGGGCACWRDQAQPARWVSAAH